MLKVILGRLKLACDTRGYSFRVCARAALALMKKKRSLRNGKLKDNRTSATEDRVKKGRG